MFARIMQSTWLHRLAMAVSWSLYAFCVVPVVAERSSTNTVESAQDPKDVATKKNEPKLINAVKCCLTETDCFVSSSLNVL